MGDYRDEVRERLQEKAKGKYYKMPEGENVIRILPNAKDKPGKPPKRPYFEHAVHREIGPKKRVMVCGIDVRTKEGECWMCKQVEKMLKSDNKAKVQRAETQKAQAQLAVQIAYIDPNGKKMQGPALWTIRSGATNRSMDSMILSIIGNRRHIVSDPKKGFNINIERTGTGRTSTKYSPPQLDEEPSEVPSKILKGVKSFEELIGEYDELKQKNAYFGREDDEEEDEDEDDKPKKKKKSDDDDEEEKPKGKKKKPSEDDDEEEAEDDDDADDDDEDEESEDDDSDDESESDDDDDDDEGDTKKKSKKSSKPASSKGKSKSKDEDDEDDDDSDDEDDDDEDDDDEEDDEEEEEDDEEEESDDDEEDNESDDSDDDDDEEEEKPKAKKGKAVAAKKKKK